MKVRRCLGFVIAHKKDGMTNGTEQCKKPAVDGLHCEKHQGIVLEGWMEVQDK